MINRVVLVGRLTRDLELRRSTNGNAVVSFTVACDNRFAKQEENKTDFISCVAWNKTAEFMAQYAKKGSLVGLEGRIQTRNYDSKDGHKVYVTEVVCDSVQLLESKSVSTQRANDNMAQQNKYDAYEPQPEVQAPRPENVGVDVPDDDLPF